MSVSHKYRTFNQLLDDVSIDFSTQAHEGMIEPQQLIKVATRVNYDLGLKIHRTKEYVLEVEHKKAKLPADFKYMNYAWVCGEYKILNTPPSGTTIDTTQAKYTPDPDGGDTGPCDDPTCKDVCVVQTCPVKNDRGEVSGYDGEYMLIQKVGAQQYYKWETFYPLRLKESAAVQCHCPNVNIQAADVAEIRDGFLLTSFDSAKVYINYLSSMEDTEGNLLVLDHPYCNEYYEYALKQRILENMVFAGETGAAQQLNLIEQRLRAARNNALSFVNTPNFKEFQKWHELNRKAQYHNYYNMFKSTPTVR